LYIAALQSLPGGVARCRAVALVAGRCCLLPGGVARCRAAVLLVAGRFCSVAERSFLHRSIRCIAVVHIQAHTYKHTHTQTNVKHTQTQTRSDTVARHSPNTHNHTHTHHTSHIHTYTHKHTQAHTYISFQYLSIASGEFPSRLLACWAKCPCSVAGRCSRCRAVLLLPGGCARLLSEASASQHSAA
jgi:hypothetical protein